MATRRNTGRLPFHVSSTNRSDLFNEEIAAAFAKVTANELSPVSNINMRLMSTESRHLLDVIDEAIPLRPPHVGSASTNGSSMKRKVLTNYESPIADHDYSSNAHV